MGSRVEDVRQRLASRIFDASFPPGLNLRESRLAKELAGLVPSHKPIVRALRSGDAARIEIAIRPGVEINWVSFMDTGSIWARQAVAMGWMNGPRRQ